MIIAYQDTAEGVYLASGGAADNSDTANNIKCDSQYMNGNWQAPDYSGWRHQRIQTAVRMSGMSGIYSYSLWTRDALCGFGICWKLQY